MAYQPVQLCQSLTFPGPYGLFEGRIRAFRRLSDGDSITYRESMSRMGPEEHAPSEDAERPLARRWRALTPPQQFVVGLLPVGFVLAFTLSLIDSVPTRAALASKRLGVHGLVDQGIFGVHPWTWAHFFGWMALAGAVALALGGTRRMLVAGVVVFGLSVGIEFMQSSLTNERGYSFEDVVANGSGIAFGVVGALLVTNLWAAHARSLIQA